MKKTRSKKSRDTVPLKDSVTRFIASRIFSKIRGYIRNSRCTTGINDTGGKFANEHLLQRFHLSGKSYQRRSMNAFGTGCHRCNVVVTCWAAKPTSSNISFFRLLIYLTFFSFLMFHVSCLTFPWFIYNIF